jgi:CRISPR-associated protein Cas1
MHDESKPSAPKRRSPREATCVVCGNDFRTADPLRTTCSKPCRQQSWKDELQAALRSGITATPSKSVGEFPSGKQKSENPQRPRHGRSETTTLSSKRASPDVPALSHEDDDQDEEQAWLERAQYWEAQQPSSSPRINLHHSRKPERTPLVLNGHGARLQIQRGALVVRNGFTHYPQKQQELRYFPGEATLPSRIIALDCDGSISLDVIRWLAEQKVPLILLNWQGEVVSVMSEQGPFDPGLRQAQLDAFENGRGLELSRQLIQAKIRGCQETLLTFTKTPRREIASRKLEAALEELDAMPATFEEVRMIEARAALAYFTHWQELALHWKGTGRRPIPAEWQSVGLRKGLYGGGNRHATHPVNAVLNYAYAALESQVRIAAVGQGLDPTIGYLHARHPDRMALLYDLMEPFRPKVDERVLGMLQSHVFYPTDFLIDQRGVCRLHPQIARVIARLSISNTDISRSVEKAVFHLKCAAGGVRHTA